MTDSKEDRLRALEDEVRRLRAMLESAPDFITRISVDGKFLYLNRLAPGFQMSDVIGTSVNEYVPAEYRAIAREAIERACETGTVQQYANLGRTGIDSVGHYLTRISPVTENGVVTSLVMIATDVSALEQNRILLQVALDATGLGIWTMLPDGTGTWDETARRIFGVPDDVADPNVGALLTQRIHEDDRLLVSEGLEQALRTGRYGPIEHRIVRDTGELRWVAASGTVVRDHSGNWLRIVGSMQDITHRRVLEARLLEAQKLESIGRLAGGVAHDFNNMLTAILGNVHLAASASSLEDAQSLLGEVREAAERSAALTAQLLAFARRQMIEPKVVDLNALIGRLSALLRRLLGEHIRLELDLASDSCVKVDASQLEQVVLNLVTNARDSMPNGGRLGVRTEDIEVRLESRSSLDLAPGPYARIVVSDTGSGISAEALPHVFEPFFTTRQGGTGLGLATCYGIVKQSNGHIAVQSTLGQGASFVVYLPRVDLREAPRRAVPVPMPPSVVGERVLVVEDEPAVRSVIERTLTLAHYQVVVAENGAEGLRIADAEGPFDLLITDAVMPSLSGWEVGRILTERWPKLSVLYISGYSESAAVGGGVLESGLKFLQKPFSPSELLAALRSERQPSDASDGVPGDGLHREA